VPDTELIGRLGVWEGYQVIRAQRHEANVDGGRPRVWVELEPIAGARMTCSGCGRRVAAVHDVSVRVVRDLPLFDAETFVRRPRRRVQCPWCGPKLERLSWLHRYARVTRRLAESVVRLCQQLPIKHVADFYGLGWDTVKDLDKAALEERLGPPDLDGREVLAMDEFAIQKGQRYATVIIEPRRKQLLWVGRGRDRECVRAFLALLGPERATRIRAVAMDMHAPFFLEVQAHCRNAEIVFDLSHVVAKYGREVLDDVPADDAATLPAETPLRPHGGFVDLTVTGRFLPRAFAGATHVGVHMNNGILVVRDDGSRPAHVGVYSAPGGDWLKIARLT
jgi:transposase